MRTLSILGFALAFCLLFTLSAGAALTLTDGWGRTVVFEHPAQRIVSLTPANTEIVYFLDLDPLLLGVTEYCNYPAEAREKERIGSLIDVDLERVVALQPDLILAGSLTTPEAVERLVSFGFPVFVLDPGTVTESLEAIDQVAQIAGIAEQGAARIRELADAIEYVTGWSKGIPEEQRPDVLHIIWHDPIWTVGGDTFVHQFIEMAGGRNLTADLTGYANLDLEELLRRNPSIITVDDDHGDEQSLPFLFVTTDPRLHPVRAVRDGRVYRVDSDIVSRPGPRVAEAVKLFARIFYPEEFGEAVWTEPE
ncbi:MAG TPA: helical backbone metal receptor [Atribacteraceae bacterium]|nr:helical backbone metal receptor [Atribacteraceae bacterium]